MPRAYLQWGSWNATCAVCGFRYKADQLKKRWDGLIVCEQDWEIRHPQDLIRIPKENQSVPWTRPEPQDTFITGVCTPEGITAIAGYAVAGCAIAGLTYEIPSTVSGTFNNEI